MAIPSNAHKVLGASTVAATKQYVPDEFYVLTGTDLNDLAALAARFNHSFTDPNENRDWQTRINLMLMNALDCGPVTNKVVLDK
jgi:hypothetical protein